VCACAQADVEGAAAALRSQQLLIGGVACVGTYDNCTLPPFATIAAATAAAARGGVEAAAPPAGPPAVTRPVRAAPRTARAHARAHGV
jgi:hypothetical protein